jgi:YidC/Oxa1 family membrane protein insertase
MDKNSIIGAVLIVLILIGGTMFFSPKEPVKTSTATTKTDSLLQNDRNNNRDTSHSIAGSDTTLTKDSSKTSISSLPALWQQFGKGDDKEVMLENEKLKIRLSSKGGRISYVELKGYKTFDGKPLVLATKESSKFGYKFISGNDEVSTADLFFTPHVSGRSVDMVLDLGDGKSIHQKYSMEPNSFLVDHQLDLISMDQVLPRKINYIDLDWDANILVHEKDVKISRTHTTVFYRNHDEKPDNLSETKDDEQKFKAKTDWVSFKEQFFCQTIISKTGFDRAEVKSVQPLDNENVLKSLSARLSMAYNHEKLQSYKMQFFYGPLHYETLGSYNLDLERQIPLGWGFFITSWVNRFVIIPIFNLLSKFMSNYGLIILVLTIIIKLITLPFTYKSYLSTAKMKILKPELDELKKKYGDDMTKIQSEQMKIYRQAGVSPFGGCLPLLFQFPILIAMFRFFPSSIELRQQAFLWAKDLSTYDSIWDFGNVPIIHGIYGDHVSLFTLLMTVSTIIYSYMNANVNPTQNEFKWMSYLMPIFFLGLFNNYSAGLSLYYFLFNVLTFAQQYLFKLTIDEKKLIAQIEANKKKPAAQKKSKFQQRLEEIANQQKALQAQKAKKR